MAAIFKLRRGTSASPALTDGELFLNYTTGSIQYASGSSVYSLLPLDKSIGGNIVLNGDITASNLNLSGDATIDGNIVLGGSIFLGDGDSTDEIIVNASLSGSLIPDTDAEYDLGSTTYRYKNLHVVSASIEDIKVPGSGILSSSVTDFVTYSSSVDDRLIEIFATGSDHETRLDDEEAKSVVLQTLTASYDDRLSQLETETGSIEDEQGVQDGRLTNLELDSASQDNRLDNLELTSQSHDDRITQLETDTGSQDNRLDNLELTSASHDDRLNQLEVDSGSQDGRLTNLELTSASHDDRLSQIETETGSLSGRLDVEEEKSTTLTALTASYEDRLNQLESDSGSQEGRLDNLELTSASHESRLDLLSDVSHSHSNKANLDTIDQDLAQASNVTFNTGSFTGNVTVNGNLTVLGSATEISTTELSIEDKLITLASGSADSAASDGAGIYIDGANKSITWDHNTSQFVFDAQVSSSVGFKGDGEYITNIQHGNVVFGGSNIVSGSSQVTQSLDLRYLEINGDSVVSGSEQIVYGDITSIPSNIVSSSTDSNNIDFDISNGIITANLFGGIVSGSSQVTQSLDLRYLEINGDGVVSGSSQVTQSLDGRYEQRASSTHTLVSGSQQVIDFLPTGTVSGSSQVTQSLDLRYLEINGDNVVSGSSQVTQSLDLRYESIGNGIVSSSTYQSNHQGAFTASINGTNTNIDLGLEQGDSPTFSGLSLSSLSELGSGELNALVSGSAGSVGYRVLGTAAFLNVSNSIDNDQNVIPTNFAVNQALIAAGAGDITSVNPSSTYGSGETTGLLHNGDGTDVGGVYGTQGDIVLEIATGSAHFLGGIKAKLDADGVLSSSAQFDELFNIDNLVSGSSQLTSSLDLRYLEINGDGVISGSSQLTASFDDRYLNTISDGVVSGSSQLTSSYDLRYLEIGGDNVVSGSDQINSLFVGTAVSTSIDSRLDTLEGESHENPLTFSDTAQVDLIRNTDTITANLKGGVVSGSQQVIDLLPNGTVSGSSQVTFTELSGISNNIISSSSDTSNVDMIINGGSISANLKGGVVSGSLQINDLFAATSVSTSLDSRIDTLEGVSHTHSNKANLDSINQDLSTTSNVGFNNGAFGGNLTVTGNLEVLGTSAEIQVSELRIEDKLITVASGSASSAAANGAGIEIAGANQSITWNSGDSRFVISTDTRVSGDITATGDVVAYSSSDINLKNNIQPISNPLEKINLISGNSFVWNEEKQNIYKGKDYGVIAQEIEEILPELVQTREDGYKAVKYDKIVSLLIEGIKELSKEVTDLKNRLG